MKNSKKFFQKKVKKNTYFQKKVLISNNYGFFELKNLPLLGKLKNSIVCVGLCLLETLVRGDFL